MSITVWAVLAAVVFLGCLMQSVVGIGIGLLGAPVIAIVAPALVPQVPLWIALGASVVMLVSERGEIDWRAVAWALPARVPGTMLGVWLVTRFTEAQLGLAIGAMVLIAVLLSLRAVDVPPTPGALVAGGFGAGVSGTATSIGGPPIAVVMQRLAPGAARSTMAVFFLVGVAMGLIGFAVAGEYSSVSARTAAYLAPVAAAGLLLGIVWRTRVDAARIRSIVLAACAVSALVLLVHSTWPWLAEWAA